MTLNYPTIQLVQGEYRKSVTGRTLWCGPFCLAVITGLSYEDAYAKALAVEKRRLVAEAKARGLRRDYWTKGLSIQGLHHAALARTAERLGIKVDWTHHRKARALTLLTFTRNHTVKGKTYILIAGDHYVTICDGVLYHSHHDPMPVEDAPRYRKALVTAVAEVRPRPEAIAA